MAKPLWLLPRREPERRRIENKDDAYEALREVGQLRDEARQLEIKAEALRLEAEQLLGAVHAWNDMRLHDNVVELSRVIS